MLFSAGTGMRQGECFGLTVDRIDFLRRTVRVDRQLVGAVGGLPEFGPPKSEASQRTVLLPTTVVALLAAHLAEHREGPQRLVFTNTEQRPLRRNTFNTAWHRAADANGLPGTATFHDLRHFYASLLIARGCSVKAVQHRLGHNSAMETLDTYAHLWPDSDNETREAVDGAFASIRIAQRANASPFVAAKEALVDRAGRLNATGRGQPAPEGRGVSPTTDRGGSPVSDFRDRPERQDSDQGSG